MVYVLLGTGFEEVEAIAPVDLLRRAGIPTLTVGVDGKFVKGGHGITVEADITIGEMDLTDLDMIVLPGGLGGVATAVLADLDITNGKDATCYPGCESGMGSAVMAQNVPCIRDGKLITGASAGCAIPFGLMLVEALKGADEARRIADQIVIR